MKTDPTPQHSDAIAISMSSDYQVNIPQISASTDAPEEKIAEWMHEGKWNEKSRLLLTTKHQQLERLYAALAELTMPKEKKEEEEKEKSSLKDLEQILKLTNAIKNLETETTVSQMFEVGKLFIAWVCKNEREAAREIVVLFDNFIREQLNITE